MYGGGLTKSICEAGSSLCRGVCVCVSSETCSPHTSEDRCGTTSPRTLGVASRNGTFLGDVPISVLCTFVQSVDFCLMSQ